MAASPFEHSPLIDNETYFRLLKIRSLGDAGEISCDVESFPLATSPSFEALSYTWGNPFPADQVEMAPGELFPPDEEFQARSVDWIKETHEIHCNGSIVHVSLNLFELLTHLKSLGVVDYIWIDRICIDQSNLEEKSAQVRIMPEIYNHAYTVKIWLGRSSVDSVAAAEVLSNFAGPIYDLAMSGELGAEELEVHDPGDGSDGEGSLLAKYGLKATPLTTWFAWTQFFRRAWFFRRWTLQETALARRVRVLCGHQPFDWYRLRFLVWYFSSSGWDNYMKEHISTYPNQPMRALVPRDFVSNSISDSEGWQKDIADCHGTVSAGSILTELLYASLVLQCSDPRDVIYSIKGTIDLISPLNLQIPLKIDYAIDPSELYIWITSLCLETCPTLSILSLVRDISERSTPNLPSWVPDFQEISRRDRASRLGFTRCRPDGIPYNAGNVLPDVNPARAIRGSELHLNGFKVGEVMACATPIAYHEAEEYLPSLLDLCSALPHFNHHGEHRLQVLWRSLAVDIEGPTHPAPMELEACFCEFILMELCRWKLNAGSRPEELMAVCDQLTRLGEDHPGGNPFQRLAEGAIWRTRLCLTPGGSEFERVAPDLDFPSLLRFHAAIFNTEASLFRTSNESLGTGPQSCVAGDQVWVLENGRVPFVLRPTKDSSSFELIGECYVHGIMIGQLMAGGPVPYVPISLV